MLIKFLMMFQLGQVQAVYIGRIIVPSSTCSSMAVKYGTGKQTDGTISAILHPRFALMELPDNPDQTQYVCEDDLPPMLGTSTGVKQ